MASDLFKKYVLIQEIGKGTYGKVYKARDLKSNQIVAAKRVYCEVRQEQMKNRVIFLERERKNLLEMASCPNVVRLVDWFEFRFNQNAIHMDLIFEYCTFDLRKVISNSKVRFQIDEVKCFLRQILNGLLFMHGKKIIHRDMKTDNILLTKNGIVKIADLGLSRKLLDPIYYKHQYTNTVVTLWYRAPELLLGDTHYSASIDLWSLGCVMAEFWTRAPILCGSSESNQLKLILELCGSIDPKTWPGVDRLKLFNTLQIAGSYKRKTRTYLNHGMHSSHANNMFDSLLTYDPSKRYDAWNALNDDFFFTDPLPARDLSKFMERIAPRETVSDEQKQQEPKQQHRPRQRFSKAAQKPKYHPYQYQPQPSTSLN